MASEWVYDRGKKGKGMTDRQEVRLEGYITAEEAGRILSLTVRRIRQLVTDNPPALEGEKIAGRWFVKKSSVYSYLAEKG